MYEVPKYKSFKGKISLKGDKSISHRVIIFSSLCEREETKIYNIGFSDDIHATTEILKKLGVDIKEGKDNLIVKGKGIYLDEPSDILFAYESGTTARIFCSILSAQKFPSVLDGKESLRKRPMRRITGPLREIGARIFGPDNGNRLPLVFDGRGKLKGGKKFELQVASAQVKTALLISNFWTDEPVKVKEPTQSRDHTERILPHFSVNIMRENGFIWAFGKPHSPKSVKIPGDISSAAFHIALGTISENSEIVLENVSINPTRLGFVEVLKRMGAKIEIIPKGNEIGEPYGDIVVRSSKLTNISLSGDIIPKIIDEIPILSVCAVFGRGVFCVKDAKELRVKETDRIQAICSNLRSLGIEVEEYEDGFCFEGVNPDKLRGEYFLRTFGDHRIAMSMLVLGTSIKGKIFLDDINCISKSYPEFFQDVDLLGEKIF